MNTRIVAAVGRGHWHTSKRDFREAIIDPLMTTLLRLSRDRNLATDFRNWATLTALRLRPIAGGSIADVFENDIMKLFFNGTAIANIADNAAASPLTNLYYGLHTLDPGETGNQTTSETTYTSYARVPVARTSGGHGVTANSVSPTAAVTFPAGTGGSGTVTYFAIGTVASSGTGKILFSGTVSPNIAVGNGVTPQLTTSTTITID